MATTTIKSIKVKPLSLRTVLPKIVDLSDEVIVSYPSVSVINVDSSADSCWTILLLSALEDCAWFSCSDSAFKEHILLRNAAILVFIAMASGWNMAYF